MGPHLNSNEEVFTQKCWNSAVRSNLRKLFPCCAGGHQKSVSEDSKEIRTYQRCD
jgi:hypothetical protein